MKYVEISMSAKICFKDETSVEEIEGIKRLVVNGNIYVPELGLIKYDADEKRWIAVDLNKEQFIEPGYHIIISHNIEELDELPNVITE
ncbi:MAG: hypothetical protein HND52_18415 [Ignavibacteriae bacterium]|jgi:hypothetical protein|nr:hypothetical protein [Ignavibacteriota bacterium]NOG99938.1 hypothetical protein [Ignavibacteriota bacterium]